MKRIIFIMAIVSVVLSGCDKAPDGIKPRIASSSTSI